MSEEAKMIRALKADSAERAALRIPEKEGQSKLSTIEKRQQEEVRRDEVLEDIASGISASSEKRDTWEVQMENVKKTLFEILDSVLVEFESEEMDKDVKERIKDRITESVLFVELAGKEGQEERAAIEDQVVTNIEALFKQPDLQKELDDRIEGFYKDRAQYAVKTYRELNPAAVAPDLAEEIFQELKNTAKDLMIPEVFIDELHDEVLKAWNDEYLDVQRNLDVIESELDSESAQEIRDILGKEDILGFLRAVEKYGKVFQHESVRDEAREALRLIAEQEIAGRFNAMITDAHEKQKKLIIEERMVKDVKVQIAELRNELEETHLMQRDPAEAREDLLNQEAVLEMFEGVRDEKLAELDREGLFNVSKSELLGLLESALESIGSDAVNDIWSKFKIDGQQLIDEWRSASSTADQSYWFNDPRYHQYGEAPGVIVESPQSQPKYFDFF